MSLDEIILSLLAALSCLLILAITGLCRLARRTSKLYANPAHGPFGQPFRVLCTADAFETDSSMIWETQIAALELIARSEHRGVSIQSLAPLYCAAARLNPELDEGSTLCTWLEFLSSEYLIERDGNVIRLTQEGRAFLAFLVQARLPRTPVLEGRSVQW